MSKSAAQLLYGPVLVCHLSGTDQARNGGDGAGGAADHRAGQLPLPARLLLPVAARQGVPGLLRAVQPAQPAAPHHTGGPTLHCSPLHWTGLQVLEVSRGQLGGLGSEVFLQANLPNLQVGQESQFTN